MKKYKIAREPGAVPNPQEQDMIDWIARTLGGEITFLKKSDKPKKKRPDLRYNGKLFDIKHTKGNLNTLDSHVRYAAKQTNHGGVFIDITGARYSSTRAISKISERMARSGLAEAYIKRKDQLIAHLTQK